MADLTKTPKAKGGPAVRQMRGPGMNLGLKKPRYGKFSKAENGTPSTPKSTSAPSGGNVRGSLGESNLLPGTPTTLSSTIVQGGRKSSSANPGSKVIASKQL